MDQLNGGNAESELFGRAKQAARERASERRSREGPRKERALFQFSTDPRFSVSSRVPLARLLSTISSKGRDCSQAKSEFKNISRGCWFYTRFDFNKVYFCDQPKPAELLEKDWSFAFGLGWNDILPGMAGWHNGFSEEPRIDERIVGASAKVWKVFRA